MDAQAQSPLYQRIASQLEAAIASGALRPGDRLPSVRQLSQQYGVSLTTALQAFRWLENRGVVEARPKSGYFVAARAPVLPEPRFDLRIEGASFVSMDQILHELLLMIEDPQAVEPGTAMPLHAHPPRSTMPAAVREGLLARGGT